MYGKYGGIFWMNIFKREPMPYGSVLLVDDVETNLFVAIELFKPYRLRVDTVASGQDAIERIKDGKIYDIIFMDHLMPVMDGIETTHHIRGMGYTHPIIAVTADKSAENDDLFLNNGFDSFIPKPINKSQIDTILKRMIRDKQPKEVLENALLQESKFELNENTQSNESLLRSSFIRDATKAVNVIDKLSRQPESENQSSMREFIVNIHGIKSSLHNIGEEELSAEAHSLEKAARHDSISIASTKVQDFLSNLRELLKELKANENEDIKDADIGCLCCELKKIQELCASFDRKGVLDVIAGLENCSAETRAVLDELAEFVLHSYFDEAESTAAAYAATLGCKAKSTMAGSNIDGLDILKGLEKYDGNEKTYIKILRSYARSLDSMLGTVEALREDALVDYKIAVHGIKGASYDIYAEPLGKKAEELEHAAREGNYGFALENNPSFLKEAHKLVADISGVISVIEAENPKPKKDKPDELWLKKLRDACKLFDMNGADSAMEEIEKYEYESDEGLVEWLRYNFDIMGFSQIVKRLTELMA
jgi:CheY-like chemotaxis protein